jgi:kynurenine formamidase
MADRQVEAIIRDVSNWGRWGAEDELGTVNFITRGVRAHAASLVRTGKTFSLSITFDLEGPQPSFERRSNPRLTMLQTGTDLRAGVQRNSVDGWGYADDSITMALQCATHWDALSHAFYDYKMYNDRGCELVGVEGALKNSISALAASVVTRGVLLDIPATLGMAALPPGFMISPKHLEETFERQRVEPRNGDILLIRTGHMAAIRSGGSWDGFTYADEPGPGLECLPWLHEHDVAGVGTDTWAFEAIPSGTSIWLPVHAAGIVHMGLLVGEIFSLEALAADCAADGIYEFLFSAVPLPITGAVGSPVNPIAVK